MSSTIISLITYEEEENEEFSKKIEESALKSMKPDLNTQNSTSNENKRDESEYIQSSEKKLFATRHMGWNKWIRCVKLSNEKIWAIDYSEEVLSSICDKTFPLEDPFFSCLPAVNVQTGKILDAIKDAPYEDVLMRLNYGLAFFPYDTVDWKELNETMQQKPLETIILNEFQFQAMYGEATVEYLLEIIFTARYKITGKIVIICANEGEVEFLVSQINKSGVYCFGLDSRSVEQKEEPNIREIFVCADGKIDLCHAWGASYFIHFSLPNMWETFMKRFIRYYGFYVNKAKLGGTVNDVKLPISYVFFNLNDHPHHVPIYRTLSTLDNTQISPLLKTKVEAMKKDQDCPRPNTPDNSDFI